MGRLRSIRSLRSVRTRYLVTSVFTLALVALGAVAHAAEAGDGRREPALFASDAVALHAAGWILGDVDHEYAPGGVDDAVTAWVVLVDPTRTHALRLSLDFAAHGDQLGGYRRGDVAVPAERRVYEDEDAFFDGLAHGAVQSFYEQCDGGVLGLVGGDAFLPEDDWHIVRRHIEGKAAGAVLGEELRARLRGSHIVDVHESSAGIAFVLAVDDFPEGAGLTVVEAQVDATGKVLAVEVREAGAGWMPGKLSSQGRLARALRGRAIRRVSVTMQESSSRVRLEFTRGKAYVIDLADMVYPEDEGCGC